MISAKTGFITLFTLVLASSAWAERYWPETSYDCQVETSSGVRGLVTIQALSLDQASLEVVGKWASTTLGGRERAVSVTECVEAGKGEFRDLSFQAWRDKLDR